MSVEPVTVTTRHNTDLFDLADHQRQAAEQMGLNNIDAIHCIATGPDGIEMVKDAIYSQDGTELQPRVLRYIRRTTWEERPRTPAPAEPQGAAPPETVDLHWPTMTLPRGARWSGRVIIDKVDAERAFISTGTEMVLVSSPEGLAVMKAIDAEREAEAVAADFPTGG